MPEKLRINLTYASRYNVLTDFGIIVQTVAKLVR
jgi:hypothetical protein